MDLLSIYVGIQVLFFINLYYKKINELRHLQLS